MGPRRPIHRRHGARLPHWSQEGANYFVTFRLGDSLPRSALVRLKDEREALLKAARKQDGKIAPEELARVKRVFSEKLDGYLDAGYGACWMKRPEVAQIVASALKHFDGYRYELIAWSVMPNHVHTVVQPLGDRSLAGLLHSWKSYTSKRINETVKRSGELWEAEYFDHLIRGIRDLERFIEYTLGNPESAGLDNWQWIGGRALAQGHDP